MMNTNLRRAQENYKANRNECLQCEPFLAAAKSLFVEQPPLSTFPAARIAAEGYTKLLPRRQDPYHVVSVGPQIVEILQDGIEDPMSNNRIIRVPRGN